MVVLVENISYSIPVCLLLISTENTSNNFTVKSTTLLAARMVP